MTGLSRSRGELVFLIDSDLEEDPAWLPQFHLALTSSGADVVHGVQGSRKGGWFERVSGALSYRLFNHLLSTAIPANMVTARLMTRRYVRALVRHRDHELCLAGVWQITGFAQQPLTVKKGARANSSYSLRRRISAFANAVTSFSNRPQDRLYTVVRREYSSARD